MSPRKRSMTKQKTARLVCPECGKTFTRPASLGAHRNRAHGIAGASAVARANAKKATRAGKAAAARSASRGKTAARSTPAASRRKTTGSPRPAAAVKRQATSRPPTARPAGSTRRRSSNGQHAPVDRDKLLQSLFPTGIPAREDAIRQVNAWLDEAERLARMR